MSYQPKKRCARRYSQAGRLAKALSLSLYPDHLDLLRQRERELRIPRSILMQLLLDIESSRSLLRPEIKARLKQWASSRNRTNPKRKRA